MSKIAFVNTLKVPSGEASVNRILSLAKGLVECGDEVHILSSAVNTEQIAGEAIYGCKVFNFGKRTGIIGLGGSLIRILRQIRKENYDVVISETNNLLLIYSLAAACKISRSKFVQEKSEFPFSLMKKDMLHQMYGQFYVKTTYKLMDGIIVMTEPLLDYYKPFARKTCQFILVPMTVDTSRFSDTPESKIPYAYVAYCGNMSGNKDGVENLIDAFSIVEKKCPDLKLLLIGGTNNPDELNRLKERVQHLNLKNVIFYGRATREEMPALLNDAKILALARPSSLQSKGGFPTKLGEYLSTGNPTAVTAVGDIPKYLNCTNSYIVPPDNNTEFAKTIISIWNNYSDACLIGKSGKKLAQEVFDYHVQSRRLHNFLNELREK